MSDVSPKRAILFLNLGGPESMKDVKPFLFRLFVDPEIIRIPFFPLRAAIAWMLATLRASKSRRLYASIGGGSPIRKWTDVQARGVEKLLRDAGREAIVRTAFTASDPLVEDVVKDLFRRGVTRFLAFPLYPQYSLTTTKGSLDRVRSAVKRLGTEATLDELRSWPEHPLFLAAHADLIRKAASRFSDPRDASIHVLFSAHSIPEKLVTEEGDPYRDEMRKTVEGVVRAAAWNGPWSLAWQSKLGPVKWLEPFTDAEIHHLAEKGVRQLLVVPIAFVTDHIETLNEIDIQFADEAKAAGIPEFRRTPGLNDHPLFLRALSEIAMTAKGFWP